MSTSSSSNGNSSSSLQQEKDPQLCKIFIGGLATETNEERLTTYFATFGEIIDCVVMRDAVKDPNGPPPRSRGFGFVTFADPKSVDEILKVKTHSIDGKSIDPKRAIARGDAPPPKRPVVHTIPAVVTHQLQASNHSAGPTSHPSMHVNGNGVPNGNHGQPSPLIRGQVPHHRSIPTTVNPYGTQAYASPFFPGSPFFNPNAGQPLYYYPSAEVYGYPPHNMSITQSPTTHTPIPSVSSSTPTSNPSGHDRPPRQQEVDISNRKCFVGGLSFETTETDLRSYFEKLGIVDDVAVVLDTTTRQSRGFAFVTFQSEDVAQKACETHYHKICDKNAEVKRATPRRNPPGSKHGSSSSSLPQQPQVDGIPFQPYYGGMPGSTPFLYAGQGAPEEVFGAPYVYGYPATSKIELTMPTAPSNMNNLSAGPYGNLSQVQYFPQPAPYGKGAPFFYA